MQSGASMSSATGLDSSVLLRREQGKSGAAVLAFRPRSTLTQRSVRDQSGDGSSSVKMPNRPSAVFREIIWAVAIPIGTVSLMRIVFALFLSL
jgi:hypothetical protein